MKKYLIALFIPLLAFAGETTETEELEVAPRPKIQVIPYGQSSLFLIPGVGLSVRIPTAAKQIGVEVDGSASTVVAASIFKGSVSPLLYLGERGYYLKTGVGFIYMTVIDRSYTNASSVTFPIAWGRQVADGFWDIGVDLTPVEDIVAPVPVARFGIKF